MKVLVTGADGFVGRRLVRRLVADGRDVTAAVRPTDPPPDHGFSDAERRAVRWLPLELLDADSVRIAVDQSYDVVIHLAALASGSAAARDPGCAWTVNAAGTARVAAALAEGKRAGRGDPLLLAVSTSEVYGRGSQAPRKETDPAAPCTVYGASKLGAETAALEAWRRAGLRVVIARAFAHTGAGQDTRFVVPAFVQRLKYARKIGAPVVKVGALEPVREFLHVEDVVDAYARLVVQGVPGDIYNVASGEGISLEALFFRIAAMAGVRAIPETDPELMRLGDIPHLVGDATKLRQATGWAPKWSLDQTLREVLDAQAD